MMEEWRAVPGYEGLYEVSNKGNVKSLIKNKIIKGFINRCGYILVGLSKNGIRKKITIHRLVAQVFIENPDNLPEVNHKDEDKANNSVDNLEWCDRKYNNNYGTANIRRRETLIKNGYCTGLSREEYYKKWREEHKEEQIDYHKKWLENNNDYHKKWRENNKDYQHKYYQDHKEERRLYMRDYQRKHKKKV